MSTLGPLDHISRPSLPWRAPHLTECGKLLGEIDPLWVLTRDQVQARIKAVGQQRAAYTTCMTCASTSDRYRPLPHDSTAIIAITRELTAVQHAYPPRETHFEGRVSIEQPSDLWHRKQQLAGELEAIQALIESRREEFDGYLSGLQDTVSLADRRGTRRTRARHLGGAS